MNTYGKLTVALLFGYCMLQAGQALADTTTVSFSDTTLYFPDATISNGVPGQNDLEPDVTGMTVTFDSDTHQLLEIVVTANYSDYLNWNNLFIDTGAHGAAYGNWDYLVHSGGITASPGGAGTNSNIGDGLYQVAINYGYTYGTVFQGQPNGMTADSVGSGPISDTTASQSGSGPYILTYDFSSDDIILDLSAFTIGWVSYCGNDPMLAFAGKGSMVPEPASMILFGMGIASLATWRIRRAKK